MIKSIKIVMLMPLTLLCFVADSFSQDTANLYNRILYFPGKLFKTVNDKAEVINNRIIRQSEKYIQRLAREEKRLQRELTRKDSTAAAFIFGDAEKVYADLQNKIGETTGKTANVLNRYIPHLDTLYTALQMLDKTRGLIGKFEEEQNLLKQATGRIEVLQERFNRSDEVINFLKQRRRFLQDQLGKYGMAKHLKKLSREVYYYHSQLQEYQHLVENPSRLEAKAIAVLRESALFRNFFRKHSQLAGLFSLPGNAPGDPFASFAGLQTRDAVQQELTQRFGSVNAVQQIVRQQGHGSVSPLARLKEKINSIGAGKGEMELPDFKPNNQKTKRLRDRLELGVNLQTVKSNRFFPSTSDIGFSLGYKLNDKSIIGIGSAYKMGWGKDIRHIAITHQGVGARSFVDYRIKGSFWLSGGAEFNYRSQFDNVEVLKNYSAWQKSALVGLSKKYQVGRKWKGNVQLMYDFLWKEQVTRTQPVLFRVGYNF